MIKNKETKGLILKTLLNQFNELLDDGYDIEAARIIEDCADLMN